MKIGHYVLFETPLFLIKWRTCWFVEWVVCFYVFYYFGLLLNKGNMANGGLEVEFENKKWKNKNYQNQYP